MLSELWECYESTDEILDSIDFELSCMLFENREWYENVSEISNMHFFSLAAMCRNLQLG